MTDNTEQEKKSARYLQYNRRRRTKPAPQHTMAKFTAQVENIKYQDVRGKQLLYLKINANGKELVVNIGEKTYNELDNLSVPRETSTTVNVLKKEGEK